VPPNRLFSFSFCRHLKKSVARPIPFISGDDPQTCLLFTMAVETGWHLIHTIAA
jgi:hypothetical protein